MGVFKRTPKYDFFDREYLTAQECFLSGSNESSYLEKYRNEPYKPQILIDGKATIEQCRKKREKIGVFRCTAQYWGRRGIGIATLNPLNEKGETTNDPVLRGYDTESPGPDGEDLGAEFPLKRDGPKVDIPEEDDRMVA